MRSKFSHKLVLGTVQFGLHYGINNSLGKPNQDEVNRILNAAYDLGIRVLDTAEAYELSQDVIGNFHKQFPEKIFDIITKFSQKEFEKNEKSLSALIESDLSRLSTTNLKVYMFHNYNDYRNNVSLKEELVHMKKSGIIAQLGVSVYTNQEALDVANDPNIDIIQMPFNLFDNENQRGEVMLILKSKGKEIHVRSVFLQGLFFKKTSSITGNLSSLINQLNYLNEIIADNKMEHIALSYVFSKPYIDKVLIGVDSVDQLLRNIEMLNYPVAEELLSQIDSISIVNNELLNPSNWNL